MKTLVAVSILFFSFSLATGQLAAVKEFRGVWVATVDNIDWPDAPTINSDVQKAAFIKLADMHKRNGMNTLIVQIRPSADAFFPSQYEPWSQWLTGVQGQPPFPYYDPLEFMIAETHRRGMQFHAWMNPYRAVFSVNKSSVAATHVTRLHPEWFITYGEKKYFDPGNKDVQRFVTAIVKDVVRRYDVDAIHFDDYFYPYRIPNKEFDDAVSFKKYAGNMRRDDWRRSNTDSIILMLSKTIKETNNKCQFGISPFGVWRNSSMDTMGSNTKAGQTNYDDLYADILLWLRNNWIDYVTPQLYWETGHKLADFNTLADWWGTHSYGKNCYVGIGFYRAGSNDAWRDKNQLPQQIKKIRSTAGLNGMAFFSSRSFEKNPNGWNDSLRLNYFNVPAQVP